MKLRTLTIFVTFLSSCGSTEDISDISIPVPAAWNRESAEGLMDDEWIASFEDPQLNELVAQAFVNNRSLQAALENFRAAVGDAKVAGADRWPTLDAKANSGRERTNFLGLTVPGQTGVNSSRTRNSGASLNVSWEIDIWGKLKAAHRAAEHEVFASEADYWGARFSVAAQVAKTYFSVLESHQQEQMAKAIFEMRQSLYEMDHSRYQFGRAEAEDIFESQSLVELAKENHLKWQQISEERRRQLKILVGDYPSLDIYSSELPKKIKEIPAGLPATLLARRPDLVAARERLIAAGWITNQARAELLPTISLTGSGGGRGEDLSDVFRKDFGVWNIAGNAMQPIFQGGKLRAGYEKFMAQRNAARANYEDKALQAFKEVEDALAAETYFKRREEALKKELEFFKRLEDKRQNQYLTGLNDVQLLNQQKIRRLEKESGYLALLRERLNNRVDFHLALGGGWNRGMDS